MADVTVPAGAAADQARLEATTLALSTDFTALSHATSITAYNAIESSTGVKAALNQFDSQYSALMKKLNTY
jgi:hypothetical protein